MSLEKKTISNMRLYSNSPDTHTDISIISEPHSHDVLFGRGSDVARHIGNMFLRQLIIPRKTQFQTNGRDARKRLAYRIYSEVKELDPPGRFLLRPSPSQESGWVEVTEDKAIVKICQTLRDECRKTRSKIKADMPASSKVLDRTNINFLSSLLSSNQTHTNFLALGTISKSENKLSDNAFSKFKSNLKKRTKLNKLLNESAHDNLSSDLRLDPCDSLSKHCVNKYGKFHHHISLLRNNVISASDRLSEKTNDSEHNLMRIDAKPDFICSDTDNLCTLNKNKNSKYGGRKLRTVPTSDHKANHDVHKSCIMTLSCIGRSFLGSSNEHGEETRRIFKDLAELQENDECERAALYLPCIIGCLCQRIADLENDQLE